jgi:hypothetical protein
MSALPTVARKTVTHIQDGSRYRDWYGLGTFLPVGSTVRRVFLDSAGAQLAEVIGEINGRRAEFDVDYAEVEVVPNGAGFYTYVTVDGEDGETMLCYGTVFRRELTFPDSPAQSSSTVVKQYEDSFQRPQGQLGGRWKKLVGQPMIFDNGDAPNTVGPNFNFFTSYFAYYYQPFNSDTVELAISATKKGNGKTIVTLCQTANASSYLYLGFNGGSNTAELGFGTGPDIGPVGFPTSVLQPQVTGLAVTVPGSNVLAKYILRYDDDTKKLSFYNEDKTVLIGEWEDSGNLVPHGRGARYFGIGGNAGLFDSGVQVAFIKAQGVV